jgi:hypothetical protein
MVKVSLLLGTLLFLPLSQSVMPESLVQLTIKERAGVTREAEPVTTGLPLPFGRIKGVSELQLLDERGDPLVADIQAVNRWWSDGSLKWIHLHFQTSIPADNEQTVSLVKKKRRNVARTTLKVEQNKDRISVTTGPLRLLVRKQGFNGIAEAWLEGRQLIRHHEGGLLMKAAGTTYRSSLDKTSLVEIEKQTPLYVRIRAAGRLRAIGGKEGFEYLCRLTAYAGSSRVASQITIFNTMGPDREDHVRLEALQWEVPTALSDPQVLVGGDSQIYKTILRGEESAWIYQKNSDEYELGGALIGNGLGKTNKPLSTGWIDAAGMPGGVAVGVRWFWQLHPKVLQADGSGNLRIDLYPETHQPLDIYTGVSKTHDLMVYFHSGAESENQLRDVFAGFQKPLQPIAPLRWYTRDTGAFGKLVDADPDLFGDNWPLVKKYLSWWEANFAHLKQARDGRHLRGIDRDAYGWLDFGDGLHWVWEEGNPDPRNLAWAGNYYDFPHASLLHFLLTGRWDYYDFFVEHSRHLADIHMVHYDSDPMFIGSNRYCPPTDHVRMDPGRDSLYTSARVYVSDTFNHHKTQSLFEKYLLTGDPHALDSARKGLDYAFRYQRADESYNQPRGPGHQLLTLLAGYELTGERKYLDRCRPIIEAGRRVQERNRGAFTSSRGAWFQFGIALEGLRSYYESTGDESIPRMIQQAVDFLMAEEVRTSNLAHACGFLFSRTGDRKYLDYGIQMIDRDVVFDHPVKNTALGLRSTPYFLFYLQPEVDF